MKKKSNQNHFIEVIDSMKGGFAESVVYLADGIEITVSGEFYVDKSGLRHHTHCFDDGVEMDVVF